MLGHQTVCTCDLRHRAWNPNTGRCETCGSRFEDPRDFPRFVDPRKRIPVWNHMADHVEQRGTTLGPAERVADVVADMRARAAARVEVDRSLFEGQCCPPHDRLNGQHAADCPTREGHGYLDRAYKKAIDFVGYLAAELEFHGATIDGPIDVRAPASARLVRVQAMLWDHVRTVVQLRALIEERAS